MKQTLFVTLFIRILMTAAFISRIMTIEAQEVLELSLTPSLTEIGCVPAGSFCLYDASRQAHLFVYVPNTAQLWQYPYDMSPAIQYDLTSFKNDIGTGPYLDFVAISDTEMVFLGMQRSGGENLTVYNLMTHQIRTPVIDFGDIRIRGCDGLPSTPTDSLYVFPDSSRVLVCGRSDSFQLIVVDMAVEKIEQVIEIPLIHANPALLPWHKVLVGLDRNIYLQNPVVFANKDERDIFRTVNRPQLLDNTITVLRYNQRDANWTLLQIPEALYILLEESASSGISEIAGVDKQGYIYYWNAYYREDKFMPLLTIFAGDGEFISHVPIDILLEAEISTYLYQSTNGEIVFLPNNPLEALSSIDVTDFLLNSLSTPTP